MRGFDSDDDSPETGPKKVSAPQYFRSATSKTDVSRIFGVAIYNLQIQELAASFLVADDELRRSRIFRIAVKSADLYHSIDSLPQLARMNKSDRLGKLFSAVGAKDWDLAVSVAEEICAHEENVGHTTVARLLRSSLRSKPNGKLNGTPNSMVVSTALKRLRSKEKLDDVYLRNSCKVSIENFVAEWKIRDQILAKQLPLRSKVLLHGPPGCGKSLTAVAMGNELDLPVYMVRFDAVIGSYLGQTAINLRQVFQFAEMTPCVIVFDELDALGKKRGNPLDVGELDRIVISLMQELEHSHPAGIIVATSNLPKHLDHALWRRFDFVQEFPKPSKAEMKKFAARVAKRHDTKLTTSTSGSVEKCKSFAEVEQQVQDAARRLLLRRSR